MAGSEGRTEGAGVDATDWSSITGGWATGRTGAGSAACAEPEWTGQAAEHPASGEVGSPLASWTCPRTPCRVIVASANTIKMTSRRRPIDRNSVLSAG